MLVDSFEAMTAQQRRSVALVEYQCAAKDHCRLLTIWQGPGGRFWYLPPYTLSEAFAVSETAESARRKRTKDGLKRWTARAGSLDELFDFGEGLPANATLVNYGAAPPPVGRRLKGDVKVGLSVNCKHLRNRFVSWFEIKADTEAATLGAPTWVTLTQ